MESFSRDVYPLAISHSPAAIPSFQVLNLVVFHAALAHPSPKMPPWANAYLACRAW